MVLPNTLRAKHVFANISYEVDELRRDITCASLGKEHGIKFEFVHDRLVVRPGTAKTKQGKPYGVFRFVLSLHLASQGLMMPKPVPKNMGVFSHKRQILFDGISASFRQSPCHARLVQ